MSYKVAIIGDGGWGTTIAIHLFKKGNEVSLWSHDPVYAEELRERRINRKFLPDILIPSEIDINSDINYIIKEKDFIIFAVPSRYLETVLAKIKYKINKEIIVSLIKGIEAQSLKLISQILQEKFGKVDLAVLSGPSIALEVAKGLPTSVVVAAQDHKIAEKTRDLFNSNRLRVYTSSDIIGVQLGGALKNIVAIAAGICDGLGFGTNAKAALVTRGLVEITRLGVAMGAQATTFSGLSGLGDLVTTCISPKSRNRWVGEQIGRGKKLIEITAKMEMVAEGIDTVKAGYKLAKLYNIEMPITEKVYEVLYKEKEPLKAVEELMHREPKPETIF